ncbi:MAG TPA: SDR family oxidoreductase [Solirubrobacterales bacterium]|nr:SDR family oxidoreductase [Solirubrobacterales bacterium]
MILIAGATSQIGRAVVERLAATQDVRVFVRRPEDAKAFRELGCDVVQGDVRDQEAVQRACDGTGAVLSLIGRHFARTERGFWDVDYEGNVKLIDAAKQAGVRRFVLLSALWSDRNPGPVIFRVKRKTEDHLLASGLDYAILRPATFVSGPSSLIGILGPTIERWGLAVIPRPDSKPISFISLEDLAEALVNAALAQRLGNRILELSGAEAITLGQGAERIANRLGKRARLIRLPRWVLRVLRPLARLLGFGAYEAILFYEMLADDGFCVGPEAAVTREVLGRDPTPVDAMIDRYYRDHARTAWRDSFYGTLVFHAS